MNYYCKNSLNQSGFGIFYVYSYCFEKSFSRKKTETKMWEKSEMAIIYAAKYKASNRNNFWCKIYDKTLIYNC